MPARRRRLAVGSATPDRSVSFNLAKAETRLVWSIRSSPSRLSRLDACFAIQIDVEMPTELVTHSPISPRIARLIARPTPSVPSLVRSGVPARFIDASSIDMRRTAGL